MIPEYLWVIFPDILDIWLICWIIPQTDHEESDSNSHCLVMICSLYCKMYYSFSKLINTELIMHFWHISTCHTDIFFCILVCQLKFTTQGLFWLKRKQDSGCSKSFKQFWNNCFEIFTLFSSWQILRHSVTEHTTSTCFQWQYFTFIFNSTHYNQFPKILCAHFGIGGY